MSSLICWSGVKKKNAMTIKVCLYHAYCVILVRGLTQRPNLSKAVRSVSNEFLYVVEDFFVNLEMP